MGCLRCGKETVDHAVFCEECKKTMDDYPIKPGTVVVIPHREPVQTEKSKRKTKKKADKKSDKKLDKKAAKKTGKKPSPTEQDNKQLRRLARLLFCTALLLLGAVCYLAYMLFNK